MRDWFYVKEITNRFHESKFKDDIIYCTADSINLFRAILYNISSNPKRCFLPVYKLVQYKLILDYGFYFVMRCELNG